jgi:hypothetical protein
VSMQHHEIMQLVDEYANAAAVGLSSIAVLDAKREKIAQALRDYKLAPDFDREDWPDEQGL